MRSGSSALVLASAPYTELRPIAPEACRELKPGDALFWDIGRTVDPERHLEVLHRRAYGSALFAILPPADQLPRVLWALREVPSLYPTGMLPQVDVDAVTATELLRTPPFDYVGSFLHYIHRRGIVGDPQRRIRQVVAASTVARTVSRLSHRLHISRRTLGREFKAWGLPAPSHWLQFARIFRSCLRIQSDRCTVARAAAAEGYPDAFTLSNQMKRLLDIRPSELKVRFGWEWVIEAWLTTELRKKAFDLDRYPALDRDE